MGNNRRDVLPARYDSSDLRLPRFRYNRRATHVIDSRVECKTRHVRDSGQAGGRANEGGKTSCRDSCGDRRHKSFRSDSYTYLLIICSCGGGSSYILSRTRNSSNIISGGLLSSLWRAFRCVVVKSVSLFPTRSSHSRFLNRD